MHERFCIVPGFPAYRVSNQGRIQSRWRKVHGLKSEIGEAWHDLAPRLTGARGKRYLAVCLCRGDGTKPVSRRVHQLVAGCFVPGKPQGKCCVRHLDGKRTHNHADNLAWGSYKENEDDKHAHGTWLTRISNASLSAESVTQMRARAAAGEKRKDLAIEFKVSRPAADRAINRKTWRHVP